MKTNILALFLRPSRIVMVPRLLCNLILTGGLFCLGNLASVQAQNWIPKGFIVGETAGDFSGGSTSFNSDGTIVAIGAVFNNGNGVNSGHTRVYQRNMASNQWVQLGQDIDGEATGDSSGISVSLNGDGTIIAIGANGNDGNGDNSGHTRIYQWNIAMAQWEQMGQDIDGEAANDLSGGSVNFNLDGTIVAIGATANDGNGNASGHTRVYQWDPTSNQWVQLGQDIDGEAANDFSGRSVSLSGDGLRVAIGAYYNDGNGTDSGHTRIYQWDPTSNEWIQLGQDIDGETAGDESGNKSSMALSTDGNIVAIGASKNLGDRGHVRIYQWNLTSSQWEQLGQDIDGVSNSELVRSVSLNAAGTIVAVGLSGSGNFGSVQIYVLDTSLNTTDVSLGQAITLSPNPTHDTLNLHNNNGKPINGVRVYDLQGRLILTNESAPNKTHSINVHSLENGIYLVQIETENRLITKRFIKN